MRYARLLAAACLLALPVASLSGDVGRGTREVDPHSARAFNAWLFAIRGEHANERPLAFAAFQGFLEREGVAGVVPTWQLLRTDPDYAARCDLPAFALPPRSQWPAIVPTLRLVRDEVVPVTGRVEVHSAWRSGELNDCVNGAKGSRHLAFAAVDLVAPGRAGRRALFADLCAMHRDVGPRTAMGLGAYFDPARPKANRQGRFHIDGSGYRSWGFDYTAKSSGCRKLG